MQSKVVLEKISNLRPQKVDAVQKVGYFLILIFLNNWLQTF